MATKTKTIEETYVHLDLLSHILKRPGMYIGSIKNETKSFFLFNEDEAVFEFTETEYVPSILKIIDEVISNSCDEFRRKTNMGLTEVSVTIDNNGTVTVRDNGGIPVVKHKEAGVYVPEYIFSNLMTGSNFDDTENRTGIGQNGIGSKTAAIFSTFFSVYTADKKKSYYRSWSNNMRTMNDDMKVKTCNDHFTEISFKIDFSQFENIDELTDDFIRIIEKRCIDAAAANIGLTVKFKHTCDNETIRETEWNFTKFTEYIELYSEYVDINDMVEFTEKNKSVWFFPEGNINIGFVNGAECSNGTHIKAIHNLINNSVSSFITAKKKLEVQPKHVDGKYSTFCMLHVDNPAFDSQTKDTLTTPVSKFDTSVDNYEFTLPKKFLDDVCKSDVVDTVIDWFKQKQDVEDQKNLRKLNKDAKKKILRNDKFIEANSKNRAERELWIFEGDSAQTGFRMSRNPQTQAAYLLRGVTLNTQNMYASKVMTNKELADLVSIIGLQWGQKNKKENLNFNRIVIATDADHDGDKIAGILLVFFNHFPELFEYEMICRSISPIMIATKGAEKINIYTFKEYKEKEKDLKGYKIKYAKGLGSLNNQEYKEMIQNPKFHVFTKDDMADQSLNRWFGKGIAKERKHVLKSEV